MGTIWIRDFKGGLDTRRLPETSPGGTLIRATDCHLTSGGQIEQRADFVPLWSAPLASCVGLATNGFEIVIFGHAADAPAGKPADWKYTQLAHPAGEQLLAVPSWNSFGSELAVTTLYGNGDRYLFLDGTRVTDVNAPPQAAGNPKPRAVLTLKSKLTVGAGSIVFFSKVKDGDNFTDDPGPGFVDMGFEVGVDAEVRALAKYEAYCAVFFPDSIMIWLFVTDPDDSSPIQTLGATGTFSARTVVPFRDGDVLYYDKTGIRSLRARDSSKSAMTVDIGSPIDTLTQAAYAAADAMTLEVACGIVEPLSGRPWIAIGEQIFVLSHFPETKVTAWTVYEPGFRVDAMAVFNNRVYLRSGVDFYVYGSESGPFAYSDDVQPEAWLPYLDANVPATEKHLGGVDVACRGTWEIRAGFDPENLAASDLLARVVGSTYWKPKIGAMGGGTHVGLRFKALAPVSATEPAVLSSALIYHDLDDQEDT